MGRNYGFDAPRETMCMRNKVMAGETPANPATLVSGSGTVGPTGND
jgi:hypothetical protein